MFLSYTSVPVLDRCSCFILVFLFYIGVPVLYWCSCFRQVFLFLCAIMGPISGTVLYFNFRKKSLIYFSTFFDTWRGKSRGLFSAGTSCLQNANKTKFVIFWLSIETNIFFSFFTLYVHTVYQNLAKFNNFKLPRENNFKTFLFEEITNLAKLTWAIGSV